MDTAETKRIEEIAKFVGDRFTDRAMQVAKQTLLFTLTVKDPLKVTTAGYLAFLCTLFSEGKIVFRENIPTEEENKKEAL